MGKKPRKKQIPEPTKAQLIAQARAMEAKDREGWLKKYNALCKTGKRMIAQVQCPHCQGRGWVLDALPIEDGQ